MSNQEIATLLRHVAAAYSVTDEKKYKFQLLAYQKAADAIEGSTAEVKDLVKEGKLESLAGVGPSLRSHIEELLKTGEVKHFREVMKHVPESMFPLLAIPSFGPKTAYRLVTILKLNNPQTVIADLKKHAASGDIAKIEGFGEKSQSEIIQALKEFELGKTKYDRMTLPFATELAETIVSYMKKSPAVREIYPLGSLRRRLSTIGDVDLAISTEKPDEVINHFISYPYKERVLDQGDISASILTSGGKRVDIKTGKPERFGSLLQHFTGSKPHNIALREFAIKKKLSLSEYGIKDASKANSDFKSYNSEEKFYNDLGMDWIPPEIRENNGEIELALKHDLPKLLELKDIKGDFHLHSDYPIEPSHDLGTASMEKMAEEAIALGYEYMGFSEHNPSVSKHSPAELTRILEKRYKKIEQLNNMYKKDIRIYSLLETDILASGKLAISEDDFTYLDATIVSIHSSFGMKKEDMTKRIIDGLSHPKAKIFAHPTGRLINQRPGYEVDFEMLFDFCQKHDKALEINAFPSRLDLPDDLVREAVNRHIKLTIDTDSHAIEQMDLMRYGVDVARRGWATKNDILNAMEHIALDSWVKKD